MYSDDDLAQVTGGDCSCCCCDKDIIKSYRLPVYDDVRTRRLTCYERMKLNERKIRQNTFRRFSQKCEFMKS